MNPIQFFEYGKSRVSNLTPNTFIGGVGLAITTKEILASRLTKLDNTDFNPADILSFNIVGNNLEVRIDVEYTIRNNAFYTYQDPITYYRDYDGKVLILRGTCFNERLVTDLIFPNVTTIETQALRNMTVLNMLYIPKANIVTTDAFNSTNTKTDDFSNWAIIHTSFPANLQTHLNATNYKTVVWDTTKRSILSDVATPFGLNSPIQYPETVFVDYSHVVKQEIRWVDIYVENVFYKRYPSFYTFWIDGFTLGQTKSIKIKVVNHWGIESGFSNIINVTSATYSNPNALYSKSFYNPADIHCYYTFEGTPKDRLGVYNGTPTNPRYENISGFPMFSTNGFSYIKLPDLAGRNITQTIMFWSIPKATVNQSIYSKGADSSNGWGLLIQTKSNGLKVDYVTLGPTSGGGWNSDAVTIPVNTLHHFAFVFNIETDVNYMYIDGVLRGTFPKTQSGLRGTTEVYIGVRRVAHAFAEFSKSEIADFSISKRELTPAEIQESATLT